MSMEKDDYKRIADNIRLALQGRLASCLNDDNPTDCPFHDIRHLPKEDRGAWLGSKSDDQVIALFKYHVKCLDRKNHPDL